MEIEAFQSLFRWLHFPKMVFSCQTMMKSELLSKILSKLCYSINHYAIARILAAAT